LETGARADKAVNRREFVRSSFALSAGVLISRNVLGQLASVAPRPTVPIRGTGGGMSAEPLAPRSAPSGRTMFTTLGPERTGISAVNRYDDPRMWGDLYREFSLGSIGTGIAIGDFDGDGRPDVFVVCKTGKNRLYRNLGDFRFEDVTDKAGVGGPTDAWKTGATFVDIDNDGRLDLYVCRFGAPNLLYRNQGDGTFKECAHAFGLDVSDGSAMACFADYDRDGRLDLYLVCNVLDAEGHPTGQRGYLFHNNGNGTFADVTERAGIFGETQSHAATWWDYDNDGWPDLYVDDDFKEPDRLYRNNGDGTFANELDSAVPHTPYSSMGADLGDINNDGLIDLVVADMAASTHEKDNRGMAILRDGQPEMENPSAVPQYMRNAVYINTGMGFAMEAAYLTGLAATDWTWSVRLEDLDCDGRIDAYFTNGMVRELHNSDLLRRMESAESFVERVQMMKASPVLQERHFAFRNLGDLRFEEVGAAWGLDHTGVSFGAAFGDLDGDGDLDLIYANYEGVPTVCRNDGQSGHRLVVALRGTVSNRYGVGATVRIETAAGPQVRQLVLARGCLSSSEPILHFGLGGVSVVDRLTVEWPSGIVQAFSGIAADQRLIITEPMKTVPPPAPPGPAAARGQFVEASGELNFLLASTEHTLDEHVRQALLPRRLERAGPGIALADIDGSGEDGLCLAATAGERPQLMSNLGGGHFLPFGLTLSDEDLAAAGGPPLFFDANGDGAVDLLLTKGGVAADAGSAAYAARLFLNDGRGSFVPAPPGMLPAIHESIGAAVAADFDRSGRLGLFLGGRVVPGSYPTSPRSYLLANRGDRFVDVTDEVAPGLRHVGMVSAALWSDFDGDGWPDLILALEWGKVTCFHNDRGKGFTDWTDRAGFGAAGTGWWNSIAAADLNGDGRPDYVVGNLGLNTKYRASLERPAMAYYGAFDDPDKPLFIEAQYEGDKLFPLAGRAALGAEIPSVLEKFRGDNEFSRATLGEILGADRLAAARRLEATEFRSGVFLSQPDGTYRFEPLPRLAQIAPIFGLAVGDFDGDGSADVYAVQNSFAPYTDTGRFDGGLSLMLKGDGHGGLEPVPLARSGLVVPNDAKGLAVLDVNQDGWPDFLVTRNNDRALLYRNQGVPGHNSFAVVLRGPKGNPTAIGALVRVVLADGTAQASEVAAGSGYLSQSTSGLFFGYADRNVPREVTVRWPDGRTSVHPWTQTPGKLILAAPSP
jgi:hypothetical protein